MKINTQLFKKILFFLLLTSSFSIYATHLIYSQISVKYLGKTSSTGTQSKFSVSLIVFRDCLNGQADFDNPMEVGVFSMANNSLISTATMVMLSRQMVPITTQPGICVEMGYYETFIIVGEDFYLSTSRCCRPMNNNTVDDLGATMYTEVRLDSNKTYINPPVYFKPIAVATGVATNFDISSSDTLSDSTIYQLSTPLQGGDRVDPKPSPLPKPYTAIVYKPGYNSGVPLGPGSLITLNKYSGQLSLNISSVGVYSAGVIATKYKYGIPVYRQVRDLTIYSCNGCVASYIEKNEKAISKISIEPNPAGNVLNIKPDDNLDLPYSIRIYNAEGRLVKEEFKTELNAFSIDNFTPGIYILELRSGDKIYHSRFFKK